MQFLVNWEREIDLQFYPGKWSINESGKFGEEHSLSATYTASFLCLYSGFVDINYRTVG